MAVPAMTNNSPSEGYISWELFHIQYQGVGYEVAAGSTDQRWVWWRFNAGSPVVETGIALPEDLTADDLVLFANKSGIAFRIQASNFVDGEMIIDGSVMANAIAANQINSGHVVTDGLDASVIKFGSMSGQRIEVESITAAQMGAESVTALALAAEAVTADKIAVDALTAEKIQSGDLMAALAVLGGLTVGNSESRHIVMHPDVGFMLVDEDGLPLVHFPLTINELNRFTGDLVAQGFTAMGGAQFRGNDNEISINSRFTLASGLTKPSNTPGIDTSYRQPVPGISLGNYYLGTTGTWDGLGYKYGYLPVQNSLAAAWVGGGTGFWAGKHLKIDQLKLADLTTEALTLTFMDQEGYTGQTPTRIVSDVVAGTAAERADMTAPGALSSAVDEPWILLNDGWTNYRRENAYFSGSYYNTYVSRSTGNNRSITMQYGMTAEMNPSGEDTRPLLSSVKIYHYNKDGRRYNSKVQISADGVTWTTLWDYTVDGTYVETAAGKTHTFPEQRVLYVRSYLSGNDINTGNHWTEIQAIGYPTTAIRYPYYQTWSRPIRIGDYWYLMYTIGVPAGDSWSTAMKRKIGKFDLTGQQVQVFDYVTHSYEDPTVSTGWNWGGQQPPSMTTDGTDLIIGQIRPADGHVRFQHFSVAAALTAPYKTVFTDVPHTDPGNFAVESLLAGTFDMGAYHYMLPGAGGLMRAYDANGVRAATKDFVLGGYSATPKADWVVDRFWINDGSQLIRTSTSMSSEEVRAAYSWYDSDSAGGTHETEVGPVAVATRKPRYGVRITVPTAPPDAGDVDSPDKARIYAKQGTYSGTADLDLQGEGTGYASVAFADNLLVGAAPPVANTFPNGIAAILDSDIGGFIVKGDGTGAWPYLQTQIMNLVNSSIGTVDSRVTTLETSVDSRLDALENAPDPRNVGEVIEYYGTRAQCPAGFLIMDGASFSSSSYPALAAYLGTTILPNMTGRVARQPSGAEVGKELGGADSFTITEAQMPIHNHGAGTLTAQRGTSTGSSGGRAASGNTTPAGSNADVVGSTANAGSGDPVTHKPSYMALWHAIKAV